MGLLRGFSYFCIGSLLQRWRYGDGLLIGAALILIFSSHWREGGISFLRLVFETFYLLLVLAQAYLFNDLVDAPRDVGNPKKNQEFVRFLNNHRSPLFLSHLVTVVGLALFSFIVWGSGRGWVFLLFYALGIVYSFLFKNLPVLDLLLVGLWGGSYLGLVSEDPKLLGIIATMTAISHLFQTEVDLKIDQQSQIRTSAMLPGGVRFLLLFFLCATLVILLPSHLPLWVRFLFSALAFAPLLFHSFTSPLSGWLLTKGAFAILWFGIVFGSPYGHP